MVWACPKLGPYWEGVTGVLNDICETELSPDPMLLLLSYLGDVEGDRYTKLSITLMLFYARREIMLHWKSAEPPTLGSWKRAVDSVLPLYKLTYESRQCPAKFNKVWSAWMATCG